MTLGNLLNVPESELAARGVVHSLREIAQQPSTWLATMAKVRALQPSLTQALRKAGVRRGTPDLSVLLMGAGSSDFVGHAVANLLRSRWGCPVEVIATTDFVTHEQGLLVPGLPYMGICFSRSGSSPESVLALEHMLAREPRMPQLIVTCDADGTMARELSQHPNAVTLLLDDAVNDRGLAMTSSYSNMIVVGLCLAHWNDFDHLHEIVLGLADAWRRLLTIVNVTAKQLAERPFSKVYFLGSGALNGVARESARKVLELTSGRVSSDAHTFLGMRHGPLSGVDRRSLLVALMSSDPRVRRYEVDVLREIQRKRPPEATLIIAQRPEPKLKSHADFTLGIEMPRLVQDDYLAPVMVLFGQMFALHSSLLRGVQPDAPSPGGVIKRVVSGVEMHS